MPVAITFYRDADLTDVLDPVELPETAIIADLGHGQPIEVYGRNTGDSHLRAVSMAIAGPGAANVQLARDEDHQPGVWADAGQEIVIERDVLYSGGKFGFWARAVYAIEDREGIKPFEFVIKATSIGPGQLHAAA